MRRSHEHNGPPRHWRCCVAVLLVGFLLYNPFLALISHSDGLTYQAMPRHRATVGASELQPYSPVQGESAQLEVIVEEAFAGIGADNHSYPAHKPQDEPLAQRVELIASIWFRPPPTR